MNATMLMSCCLCTFSYWSHVAHISNTNQSALLLDGYSSPLCISISGYVFKVAETTANRRLCVWSICALFCALFADAFYFLFNKCKCKFKHSPPSVNEMNYAPYLQQEDGGGNHSRGLHCETRAPDRLRVSGTVKQTVNKKKRMKKSSPHVTEHIQQHVFPPAGWTAAPLPLLFNLFHKMIRGLGSCVPHFGKSGTREWQTFLRPWYRRPSLQVRSTRLLLPLWAVMPLLCNKAALLCHEYQLDICIPLWVWLCPQTS